MSINIYIISLGGCSVLVLGVAGVLKFNSYCADLARLHGRLNEFEKIKGTNENNLNAYEREVYRKLMSGNFSELGNHDLQLRGRKLAFQLKLLKLLCVLFVVLTAFLYRQAIFYAN